MGQQATDYDGRQKSEQALVGLNGMTMPDPSTSVTAIRSLPQQESQRLKVRNAGGKDGPIKSMHKLGKPAEMRLDTKALTI